MLVVALTLFSSLDIYGMVVYAQYPRLTRECSNRTISRSIKPCICLEIPKIGNKKFNSTHTDDTDIIWGIWLNCEDLNLDDAKMSRILNVFLSSDLNREFTRRIDLDSNQLTKIPSELSQFKRLQMVYFYYNAITSIKSGDIFNNSTSTDLASTSSSATRLIRLWLNNNAINHIEAGAFQGSKPFD